MALSNIEWGAVASIIAGAVWVGSLQGTVSSLDPKEINKQKEEAIKQIKEEVKNIKSLSLQIITPELISQLKNDQQFLASVKGDKGPPGSDGTRVTLEFPIGTIIPSVLPPDIFEKNYGTDWKIADGSRIETSTGYSKITGSTVLPDLRGVFLRGANLNRIDGRGDPEGDARTVGSYQGFATSLPNSKKFTGKTDESGEHNHLFDQAIPYNAGAGDHQRAKPGGGAGTTGNSGKHLHTFEVTGGGDIETRPVNVSVYFYVKVN